MSALREEKVFSKSSADAVKAKEAQRNSRPEMALLQNDAVFIGSPL
jgi:hypothetical protein